MAIPSNYLRKTVIPPGCREQYAPLAKPEFATWVRAGVEFSGISDLVPGYCIGNPQPARVMIIATAAGAGWVQSPRGRTELVPGTLYAGPAGEPVTWAVAGPNWRIAWWYLRPGPRWRTWQARAPGALLADLFTDLLGRSGPLAEDTAALILRHLTALAEPGPVVDRFAELWSEVERHPGDAWSLAVLARRLEVSISTAQRLAQAHLGCSPHAALVRLRLSHARELLRRTTYPLATIAELAGYADAFTFCSAYRRWAGHPPSKDRDGPVRD